MTPKTHVTFGVCTGLLFGITQLPLYLLIALGSILPDIDHEQTFLGKLIPIGSLVGHRTITHSLIGILAASIVSPFLGLGYLSHIALDMLTPSGVPFFYPAFYNKYSVRFCTTGSDKELSFFWGLLVLTTVLYMLVWL